jgi:hypothetical protein
VVPDVETLRETKKKPTEGDPLAHHLSLKYIYHTVWHNETNVIKPRYPCYDKPPSPIISHESPSDYDNNFHTNNPWSFVAGRKKTGSGAYTKRPLKKTGSEAYTQRVFL